MAADNKLELVIEVDVNKANASIKSVNAGLSSLQEGAKIDGTYEAAMGSVGKQMTSLIRASTRSSITSTGTASRNGRHRRRPAGSGGR